MQPISRLKRTFSSENKMLTEKKKSDLIDVLL